MPHEETSAAVASILSNFAKSYTPLDEHSFPAHVIANGVKSAKISLPGEDTVGEADTGARADGAGVADTAARGQGCNWHQLPTHHSQ